jgi:large subunit ribosomal protein L9
MEIILKEDITGLGYKNDIVKVKAGYGRNYLIPRGVAIIATESNRKIVAENVKQAAHKAEKIKTAALNIAEQVGEMVLTIITKAGESGKIFGAVTTLQISEALKEKGIEVDRKKIALKGDVKMLGDYTAVLDLHKEVKKEVSFSVIAG